MRRDETKCDSNDTAGFSLVEFMMATGILLVITASIFSMLGDTQRAASFQTEVQAVLDNTRIAMDTLERALRQAGNDPLGVGFEGLTIVSATEVRVRSDLTGSAGPTFPDKGDPDGDTSDSGEDLTIRYNSTGRSIEVTPTGATAQPIANYISAFSMQYFDGAGGTAATGSGVRRVSITITGTTTIPDPQTRQLYSMQLKSDVQLATRN
jgi:Tfp pilus assembly protein PilW